MDSHITGRRIREFFRTGHEQLVSKGQILLGWGEVPADMYYVEHGFIKAYSIGNDGEEFIHEIYKSHELFPLTWAYLRIARNIFYEALGEVVVYRMPVQKFNSFAISNITASHALARQTAHQLHVYSDRIDNLEYKKPAQRIAYRLLSMAERFGKRDRHGIVIDGPFTHQIIADSINLARETVSRELQQLEQKQIIAYQNRQIVVINAAKLRKSIATELLMQHP